MFSSQRSLRLCSSSALMEFLIPPKQNLLSKKVMGKRMFASPRPCVLVFFCPPY
jgi:hypothetical protein